MGSQRPSDVNIDEFKIKHVKIQIFKLHGPASILKYQKYRVATQIISYERYGEILFQTVASGYLLHFVPVSYTHLTLPTNREV